MSEKQRRRIRIEGKFDDVRGHYLNVFDAQTGLPILNIVHITLQMDAREIIRAEVTYHIIDDFEKTEAAELVELAVTAEEHIVPRPMHE